MLLRAGAILFLATLLLSGCASMNKEECLSADWRTVGFHDAAAGRAADTIGDHREACAEYGVTPNLDRYLDGRKAGLKEYCRASRGYQEGLAGRSYGGVCPDNLEKTFKEGYEAGRRIFDIEDQARDQERALREKERQLKATRKRIDQAQSLIVSSADSNVRSRTLLELQSRNSERSDLERQIDSLNRDIQRLKQDASQARSGADTRFR